MRVPSFSGTDGSMPSSLMARRPPIPSIISADAHVVAAYSRGNHTVFRLIDAVRIKQV